MSEIKTQLPGLTLAKPDPKRDALFALRWFASPHGKETLLSMGNPEHAIQPPTLEGEARTIESFIEFEAAGKQITWQMRMDNKTIGSCWIDLEEHGTVRAPSIHLMIGDVKYRGRGIGKACLNFMIEYIRNKLGSDFIYSRHLVSNRKIGHINTTLGFVNDGEPYTDEDGLVWQNTKKALL